MEILKAVAHSLRGQAGILDRQLDESQLAQLFVLMVRQFAYEDDPQPSEGRLMMAVDYSRELRDDLLHTIRNRGTQKALTAIQGIAAQFPELEWLDRTAYLAKREMLLKSWLPPKPSDLMALAGNHQVRYVQGGAHLLVVLQETLDRLQSKLQGELMPVRSLWDRLDAGKYRPIDELDLSDYIAQYLRDELTSHGIAINREVQIRRGEETDIYVDAISPTSDFELYNVVSVIIEVKGCWHDELRTAMKT